MSIIEIAILSLALAMDAFAVALASGVRLGTVSARQQFRMAFHFGLFQALMPIIGWFLGKSIYSFIENWDHWVAFALLVWVGGNMIRESFAKEEKPASCSDPTRGSSLILLSVATSLDALAVGLSFSMLGVAVWLPALSIGLTCAVLTLVGLFLGTRLSQSSMVFASRAELIGGLVLLGIGIKILFDHQVF